VLSAEPGAALSTLNRALEYALVLTLPAALALGVTAQPIVATLFGRGAFDATAVRLSAEALAAYAVGLPAFVLVKVVVPAFFARRDTAMPVKVGMIAVGLNLLMNLAFMIPLQHLGPPLASALAAWFNVGVLMAILHRRGQFVVDAALRSRVPRMALAALCMAAVLWVMERTVYHALATAHTHGLRALGLALLVGVGMLTYAVAGQAMGAFDLRALGGALLGRRKRAVAES
jgi:putative peptidoglycan lipid II flippase